MSLWKLSAILVLAALIEIGCVSLYCYFETLAKERHQLIPSANGDSGT